MGARGPAPKRKGSNVVSIRGGGTIDVPTPDSKWRAATKRDWEDFWDSDLARLVGPDAMPALRRLFTLRDERDVNYTAMRKANVRLVRGSQGQLVANPLLTHINNLDTEIRQLEDRFGLTPLSRMRVAQSFGEAAKSLNDINAAFEDDADEDDEGDEGDPRTIDVPSS